MLKLLLEGPCCQHWLRLIGEFAVMGTAEQTISIQIACICGCTLQRCVKHAAVPDTSFCSSQALSGGATQGSWRSR